MTTAQTVSYALHLLFAGLWVGGVTFVTVGLLPSARAGEIAPEPLVAALDKLTLLSRASAVVLLLTGSHLATTMYGDGALLGTERGYLVVTMVVLWIALAALVEVGASRLSDGLSAGKLREPARDVTRLYQLATVVGVVLLLIGGVLSSGFAA